MTVFEKVNLVVRDMEATVAFYRRAGLDIPDENVWERHHTTVADEGGLRLAFDSLELANHYAGCRPASVIGLHLESREAVDATFARMTEAGAPVVREPYDTFWGSRYAIVKDPDGNLVGLMSAPDEARVGRPPELG